VSRKIKTATHDAKKKTVSERTRLLNRWSAFYAWKQRNPDALALPMPPNMANARMHWRTKDACQNVYADQCATLLKEGLLPDAMLPVKARLTATLHTQRSMDWDNLTARMKWAVDWLVRNDYLVGDDPAHCEMEMPKQARAGLFGGPPRIEFSIEEVQP